MGSAAVAALSLMLTPALAATIAGGRGVPAPSLSLRSTSFTPAVTDPRLAAELTRRGLQANSFRLAPAAIVGSNKIRVAVRARAAAPVTPVRNSGEESSASPVTAITPTVYNLGVSLGWKRFALSGDVDRVSGGPIRGGHETAEVGVSYSGSRFTARAEAGAARADPTTPRILAEDQSYTVGVGGSYRLSRNLDLTGGVRYKIQRDRLEPLADQTRDSKSVFIGTAFRF
jgi:hypothetical protein